MRKASVGRRVFVICNYVFIAAITISCLVPILNVLALSFSDSQAIIENKVGLMPVDFTLKAYEFVMKSNEFWTSVWVTVKRVLIGVPVNLVLTVLAAYPLSKSEQQFKSRKFYVAYFLVVMVFSGGLIPTYYVVSRTGLMDSVWSLILPGAVPIFNVILVMNFFRNLPRELEESAMLDGAGQWKILLQIFIPLSKPSLATVTLFSLVNHWNSWFDGLIYSNFTSHYPLQSYLQTLIVSTNQALMEGDLSQIMNRMSVNDTNLKAAQIFISIIPLLLIYPFLQKYFTTGLVLGSVKG